MNLDQSHRVVLENLATFERAKRCVEETDTYIQSVLQEIADELSAVHAPQHNFSLVHSGWWYLQTRTFPDWNGTGTHLLSVGVERLTCAELLNSDSSLGARAYIYSELLNNAARANSNANVGRHLRQLTPPEGFRPASQQMHGYLFVAPLAPIAVETLCDRESLKRALTQPLVALVSWFAAHAPGLELLRGADVQAAVESV